jgi:hypothetical protein
MVGVVNLFRTNNKSEWNEFTHTINMLWQGLATRRNVSIEQHLEVRKGYRPNQAPQSGMSTLNSNIGLGHNNPPLVGSVPEEGLKLRRTYPGLR